MFVPEAKWGLFSTLAKSWARGSMCSQSGCLCFILFSIVDEELNLIKEKVGLLPEGIQKKIIELETAFDDGKFLVQT